MHAGVEVEAFVLGGKTSLGRRGDAGIGIAGTADVPIVVWKLSESSALHRDLDASDGTSCFIGLPGSLGGTDSLAVSVARWPLSRLEWSAR